MHRLGKRQSFLLWRSGRQVGLDGSDTCQADVTLNRCLVIIWMSNQRSADIYLEIILRFGLVFRDVHT